ncbi:hypothetical protein ACFFMP_04550 [Pseudoroseomonas cervicalis]|uniref:Glycosyltransferase, family 8 n=1 Tax=Pseudoroseomonas cervicalis ATCC 49957 TaxID=525371 RepID=D5RKQ1_9PROT|nr:hypothetical protein [Pseudoroseomonas cervicalis]EFH12117.1 glycosyltransferase, family 8 [Pseudoroseomonas cervicalis ATCC 49957]
MGSAYENTAILHVLNRDYLLPLRVLRHSLMRQGAFEGCPTVIITDDPVVAEDPFIRRIATRIEFFDAARLAAFAPIRGERIDPRIHAGFAPKYTFLKLSMFQDRGYDRHIFLDADMLCLRAPDAALLTGPQPAKAVQEYGASVFPIGQEPRPENAQAIADAYLAEYGAPCVTPIRGINSGFVVLERPLLAQAVFDRAIAHASGTAFPNEQNLTTRVIADSRQPFLRLPLWYNARRRIFGSLGPAHFETIRDRIVFLHYTPGKPWAMGPKSVRSWDRLWLDQKEEAEAWARDLATSML